MYIKKNVNMGLLLLVIVLAAAITALGIYYNYDYGSLSQRYTTQLDNLKKVTDDLMLHKSKLNQTASELRLKEQDESDLNVKYTELRDDNERLDRENTQLDADLKLTLTKLNERTTELADAKNTVATQDLEIADLEDDLDICKITKSNLEDKVDELCIDCPGSSECS